jgi:D-3-phosphoglycerate dehydrogenase
MAAHQLMAYVEKGEIVNSVNYPNVNLDPCSCKNRIVILADNNPAIAREIAKVFVDFEKHIKAKVSKVRGEFAFYAFDIDVELPLAIANKLKMMEGINRLRVIS